MATTHDPNASWPYWQIAPFTLAEVSSIPLAEIEARWQPGDVKVLVGGPPCQPFSTNNSFKDPNDKRRSMMGRFAHIAATIQPDYVVVENVPPIVQSLEYQSLCAMLSTAGYASHCELHQATDYGVPQYRTRVLAVFSKRHSVGQFRLSLPTKPAPTLRGIISFLPRIGVDDVSADDRLHRTASMCDEVLERVRHIPQESSWKHIPERLLPEYKKQGSRPQTLSRLKWSSQAPTITTRFVHVNNGQYIHPTQHRGLSLREGAFNTRFPPRLPFLP